ncbi:hypothetical protein [Christiangramia sabulilitoris]|uniref:Uncharacterized protein n=1 Tax=Christiangramia sabulilitoris TaxID=2583991 RepID=A0A550I3D9_9FLAO|nr:hypothetical protein [Christiangramia sabulilitoris]TRO65485.1 hypothetical protein FGM01_08790 [Christiangramia sabulilitoris]
MQRSLFLLFLFLSALGYTQSKSYQSLASEYLGIFEDSDITIEWIKRDITINEGYITIVSYGNEVVEIQKWTIQNEKQLSNSSSLETIYYTYLSSAEEREFPAIFTLIENSDKKVEIITFEVPIKFHHLIPEGSPKEVRFLID